jgi:hypothetical protein
MKYLSVLLLGLALAACDLGASSPSVEPLPSMGAESMAADHSMEASTDASAMTATCEDAVAALDLTELAEMTTLDDASDALDDTIASCSSITDWETEVGATIPLLDLTEAEAFLAGRCAANATLAGTPICEEVTM